MDRLSLLRVGDLCCNIDRHFFMVTSTNIKGETIDITEIGISVGGPSRDAGLIEYMNSKHLKTGGVFIASGNSVLEMTNNTLPGTNSTEEL